MEVDDFVIFESSGIGWGWYYVKFVLKLFYYLLIIFWKKNNVFRFYIS